MVGLSSNCATQCGETHGPQLTLCPLGCHLGEERDLGDGHKGEPQDLQEHPDHQLSQQDAKAPCRHSRQKSQSRVEKPPDPWEPQPALGTPLRDLKPGPTGCAVDS